MASLLLAFLLASLPRALPAQSGLPDGLFAAVDVHTDATATDYLHLEEDALTFNHASGNGTISWDGAEFTLDPFPALSSGSTDYGEDIVFDSGGDDATLAYDNSGDVLGFTESLAADRFLALDASAAAAGFAFANDPGLGLYRAADDTLGFAVAGLAAGTWSASGLSIPSASLFVGDFQLTDATNVTYLFFDAGGSLTPEPSVAFDNDEGGLPSPDPRFAINYPLDVDAQSGATITLENGAVTLDGQVFSWDSGNSRFDLDAPLNLQGNTTSDGLRVDGTLVVDGTRSAFFTTTEPGELHVSGTKVAALTADGLDLFEDDGSTTSLSFDANDAGGPVWTILPATDAETIAYDTANDELDSSVPVAAPGFFQSVAVSVTLSSDNQAVNVGDAAVVAIGQFGATLVTERTFTLNGTTPRPRLLVLIATTDLFELQDGSGSGSNVVDLSMVWMPSAGDTLTLAWEETVNGWVEVARSNN